MWVELGIAVSLMLVIEGLMPSISPNYFRRVIVTVASMDDRSLRWSGLFSMIAGALLLYLLRH